MSLVHRRLSSEMRRVTSQDIARQAGVSQTTVSFVLNDRKDMAIPAETRERVLRVARELNYVPNACARGLVSGRTRAIGVSAGRPTDPHYAGLLDDLLRNARERAYHLLVVSGETDTAPQLLAEGRLDGVVVIGDSSPFHNSTAAPTTPNLPMVFVGPSGSLSEAMRPRYLVEWDDAIGAAAVCAHLAELGHRRIGMLAGISTRSNPKVRGYLEAVSAIGAEPVLLHCADEGNPYAAGREMTRELLLHHPEVTAVFCRNDLLAIGALSMAADLGVGVPRRLSVAGYTNMPVSGYTQPTLTTISTPIREAGRRGLDMLIDLLEGREIAVPHRGLPVQLVTRNSSGPPPI